jgi:urease alpha subunit
MKNWILPILSFLALLTTVFFFGKHRGQLACENAVESATTTVYDTITVTTPGKIDTATVPVPIYVQSSLTAKDSLAIFEAFFKQTNFTASAQAQQVKIQAKGFVWQNRLDSISFKIQNLRPVAHTTLSYANSCKSLNGGLLLSKNMAAPILTYQGESWGLLAGYNLINSNNNLPKIMVGITYKLL